ARSRTSGGRCWDSPARSAVARMSAATCGLVRPDIASLIRAATSINTACSTRLFGGRLGALLFGKGRPDVLPQFADVLARATIDLDQLFRRHFHPACPQRNRLIVLSVRYFYVSGGEPISRRGLSTLV